ncbi:hypothetical protein CORAM0001_1998 [Corynebacterium amycolatum SK46]|nr:hypothetical protein CORAM0001_1998 [Corynebacterium amycolatum SK46]
MSSLVFRMADILIDGAEARWPKTVENQLSVDSFRTVDNTSIESDCRSKSNG